jgi:hypothetical protein
MSRRSSNAPFPGSGPVHPVSALRLYTTFNVLKELDLFMRSSSLTFSEEYDFSLYIATM